MQFYHIEPHPLLKDYIEKLGFSPKALASVIRFKNYYEIFSCNNPQEKGPINNSYYDSYYDQSHFLKDFKRFTV